MKKKILVIEDEAEMRSLLTIRLQTSGYEVNTARSGEEGLYEIMKTIPDLIILDLMLPEMGGYEVCWRVKTNNQFSHIPILIYSARAGDIDKDKGYQCGADDYMTKPFDGEVLVNRVEKLIGPD